MANQMQATNLFFEQRVNITIPNYTVSKPIVLYQSLKLDLSHTYNNNHIDLTQSL